MNNYLGNAEPVFLFPLQTCIYIYIYVYTYIKKYTFSYKNLGNTCTADLGPGQFILMCFRILA